MRRSIGLTIISISLSVLFAGSSHATFSAYTDLTTFSTALTGFGYVSQTENFDGLTIPTTIPSGGTIGGITYSNFNFPGNIVVDNRFSTTSPSNYIGAGTEAAFLLGDSFQMTFGTTVYGLGLYVVTDPGNIVYAGDLTLGVGSNSATNNINPLIITNGKAYFIGLIDTDGLTTATFSSLFVDGGYNFNIDDITTATPVPVPSTLLLFASGMAIPLFRRRSRISGRRN